jgi:hypothetical protein
VKLKLADLACGTFDLRSENTPPTILKLDEISDGCGDLDFRDGLTLLSGLAIRTLLATLEFPLGEGGRLFTHHAATMSHLSCEGRIRNGFVGEVRSSIVETDGICLELERVKAKAHLIAEGLLVKLDGRGGRIEVSTLTLKDAQCTVGSLLIRLGVVSVSGLKVAWDEGRPRIEALKAHAKDLHLQHQSTSIDIATIELPDGLKVHDRALVEQIRIGAIEISVDEVKRKKSEDAEEAVPVAEEPASSETPEDKPKLALDMGVFDTVNGQLDVDATLSMTLPVIGKRVATHHFRIPVEGGIINYRDFERGLSDLEDTFINIRLRGDKLVLERDIPLIPGLQKPIISWELEPGEVGLASKQLVRLKTLPNFRMASDQEDDEEREKKSRVRLHRLDFDNIAVHLSLDETAVLTSGQGSLRAHIDELDLAGSLHFDPDPEDEVRPTMLGAKATGLGTVADKLDISGHALSARLTIGSVESFELGFDELRPTTMKFALKNISIGDVDYDFNLS